MYEDSGDGVVLSDDVPGPVGDDRVDPASDDDAVEEVSGKLAPTNPITMISSLNFNLMKSN